MGNSEGKLKMFWAACALVLVARFAAADSCLPKGVDVADGSIVASSVDVQVAAKAVNVSFDMHITANVSQASEMHALAYFTANVSMPNGPFPGLADQKPYCVVAVITVAGSIVNDTFLATAEVPVSPSPLLNYYTLYTLDGVVITTISGEGNQTEETNMAIPFTATHDAPWVGIVAQQVSPGAGDGDLPTLEFPKINATAENTNSDGSLKIDWFISTLLHFLKEDTTPKDAKKWHWEINSSLQKAIKQLSPRSILPVSTSSTGTAAQNLSSLLTTVAPLTLNMLRSSCKNLLSSLTNPPYTILAPNDVAIGNHIKASAAWWYCALKAHVVQGAAPSYALPVKGDVVTLGNTTLIVDYDRKQPNITLKVKNTGKGHKNGPTVTVLLADQYADQGTVVHVIDDVLSPDSCKAFAPAGTRRFTAQDDANTTTVLPYHSITIQFVDANPSPAPTEGWADRAAELVNLTRTAGSQSGSPAWDALGLAAAATDAPPAGDNTPSHVALILGIIVTVVAALIFFGVAVGVWRQRRSGGYERV